MIISLFIWLSRSIISIFRFANALCYLLDWKCSISLKILSLIHVHLASPLSWKIARVYLGEQYVSYAAQCHFLSQRFNISTLAARTPKVASSKWGITLGFQIGRCVFEL